MIFYGRVELKQSDHRPVIAIVDIDVHCVEPDKREGVFREVIQDLGPPDGTIVVRAEEESEDMESVFDDSFMAALVQDLSQIGEVILMRFVGETIWVTFRDGQCALAAARKGMTQVCGQPLKLTLKSPDWVELIEKEIEICSNISALQFDSPDSPMSEGMERLDISDRTPSGRTSPSGPPPPRPAPPGRPPQPSRSPVHERKHGPRAGVISIMSDQFSVPASRMIEESEQTDRLSPESAIYEEIPDGSPTFPIPNRPPPPLPRAENLADSPNRAIPPPLPQRQAPLPPPQHPPPSLPANVPPPVPARTGGPPIPARNPH